MKADLTRKTFDPLKHFSQVLMQQGRVQLDADWNEQAAILLRYIRTLAADLIGPQGGPVGSNSGVAPGFLIGPVQFTPSAPYDFRVGLGHYYVDGILCEADTRSVAIVFQPANATSTSAEVQVDHWTLDGAPFYANQYVEVFDDVQMPYGSPVFTPTEAQIAKPQQAQLTLTLQAVPAAVLSALANATAPKLRRVITYLTQPDYPVPSAQALAVSTHYLVYLDVWERLITYVEDDSIREVALGGPDTATRAKVVWQVKTVPVTRGTGDASASPCDAFSPTDPSFIANNFNPNRGRLKAMAKQDTTSTNPCITAPQSRYSGPENQLYRVEIHTAWPSSSVTVWNGIGSPPASAATFKWSRENGSVVFPITSIATGSGTTTVFVENLGRDDRFGLAEGNWVEIQDDDYVLLNRAAPLLQVQSIDPTMLKLILTGAADPNVILNFTNNGLAKHPLVRRWDQTAGDPGEGGLQLASDGAAYILEGTWLTLDDGVQIQFQPPVPNANQYVTSDYWLIPARTATGDVEWPTEAGSDSQGNATIVPIAKPPAGVDHHYAPLGVISLDGSGVVTLSGDCRKQFGSLAQLPKLTP